MIRPTRLPLILFAAVALSGCASIVEGTDQTMRVGLSPKEATCEVKRGGKSIATISGANNQLDISKSKNDLLFECSAPGYRDQFVKIESSASGWAIVGCVLIDLCVTDYSTGALNKYPETLTISLTPLDRESAPDKPS